MSGIVSSRGSKSGLITNLCDTFPNSGGITILNYLVAHYADSNMAGPGSSTVTNFNADNNISDSSNIRILMEPSNVRASTNYHWLFGPNYTSVDVANGGWRVEVTFRVPVKIEQICIEPVSTNASAKLFGIYHRPNGTGQTSGQIFFSHQFARRIDRASMLSTQSATLFGDARDLVLFDNAAHAHIIGYENLMGQTFLLTFGDDYYNNGNANAGIGPIVFYGRALTD
tara:strand:- start:1693 stop:2373 length:681 start_codon:yes stop_codon:yes gene_type:complete